MAFKWSSVFVRSPAGKLLTVRNTLTTLDTQGQTSRVSCFNVIIAQVELLIGLPAHLFTLTYCESALTEDDAESLRTWDILSLVVSYSWVQVVTQNRVDVEALAACCNNPDCWTEEEASAILFLSSYHGNLSGSKEAIKMGAYVNGVTVADNTALHCAAFKDRTCVVLYLLSLGASSQYVNVLGNTAGRTALLCGAVACEREIRFSKWLDKRQAEEITLAVAVTSRRIRFSTHPSGRSSHRPVMLQTLDRCSSAPPITIGISPAQIESRPETRSTLAYSTYTLTPSSTQQPLTFSARSQSAYSEGKSLSAASQPRRQRHAQPRRDGREDDGIRNLTSRSSQGQSSCNQSSRGVSSKGRGSPLVHSESRSESDGESSSGSSNGSERLSPSAIRKQENELAFQAWLKQKNKIRWRQSTKYASGSSDSDDTDSDTDSEELHQHFREWLEKKDLELKQTRLRKSRQVRVTHKTKSSYVNRHTKEHNGFLLEDTHDHEPQMTEPSEYHLAYRRWLKEEARKKPTRSVTILKSVRFADEPVRKISLYPKTYGEWVSVKDSNNSSGSTKLLSTAKRLSTDRKRVLAIQKQQHKQNMKNRIPYKDWEHAVSHQPPAVRARTYRDMVHGRTPDQTTASFEKKEADILKERSTVVTGPMIEGMGEGGGEKSPYDEWLEEHTREFELDRDERRAQAEQLKMERMGSTSTGE